MFGRFSFKNKMKHFAVLFICALTLACSDYNNYKEKIIGEWKTVDWTIKNTGQKRNNKMDFKFSADKRYQVDYGNVLEEGKWWIEIPKNLFTQEDEGQAKKVIIDYLEGDTMRISMSRAGELEEVLLIKQ